jgi:hypothetical protein
MITVEEFSALLKRGEGQQFGFKHDSYRLTAKGGQADSYQEPPCDGRYSLAFLVRNWSGHPQTVEHEASPRRRKPESTSSRQLFKAAARTSLLPFQQRSESAPRDFICLRLSTGWIERAVRFLYLNRTAFSGMYRSNKAGRFNVPFGGGERTTAPLWEAGPDAEVRESGV